MRGFVVSAERTAFVSKGNDDFTVNFQNNLSKYDMALLNITSQNGQNGLL